RGPSAAIGAVDVDVAMGEIAGPYRGAARAHADIRFDDDRAALHMGHDLFLAIVGCPHAVLGELHPTDPDLELVTDRLLAGFADRHDDAAPIGVLARNRRLDQRRIGDGHGDLARRRVAL